MFKLGSTEGAEPLPPRSASVIPTEEAGPLPRGFDTDEMEAGDDRIDTMGGDEAIVMGESAR